MTTIPPDMLLAFDTSSAACTVALFDDAGACVTSRDELIGRGHAERLVPMIAELMAGRRADQILVGVGPGSFTGIRVALAAAHGLAIGWNSKLEGLSSLALIAANGVPAEGDVAVAVTGGHGELFIQQPGDHHPHLPLGNLAFSFSHAQIRKHLHHRLRQLPVALRLGPAPGEPQRIAQMIQDGRVALPVAAHGRTLQERHRALLLDDQPKLADDAIAAFVEQEAERRQN